MNKITHFSLICLFTIFNFACGAEKKVQDNEVKTSVKADSLVSTVIPKVMPKIEMDSTLAALAPKFQDTTFAPFGKIGKKDLEKTKNGQALNAKEVKALTQKLVKHWTIDFPKFYLKKFDEIESATRRGTYKEWLQDNGNEGNIIFAKAYSNSKIHFYGNIDFLIWTLHHRTAEACPFAEGIVVFATTVIEGKIGETFVLASDLSAGDAPISSETKLQAQHLADESLKLTYSQEVYEDDALIEKKRRTCTLKIQPSGILFIEE
jgi:hypothetical protein